MLGVDFHKGRYRATCVINSRKRHLGYFETEEAAGEAYRAVAKSLTRGTKEVEAFNVARVGKYLARNLGCSKKEVCHALGLNARTVAKAVRIIRGQQ